MGDFSYSGSGRLGGLDVGVDNQGRISFDSTANIGPVGASGKISFSGTSGSANIKGTNGKVLGEVYGSYDRITVTVTETLALTWCR